MTDEQSAAGAASPASQPGNKRRRRWSGRQHWPALIARFPRLFWHPAEDEIWDSDQPVVPLQSLADYPWLSTDLTAWPDLLEQRFRQYDHRAQILQNRFWRQRVLPVPGQVRRLRAR